MKKKTVKAIAYGVALALYLRFGLEATGWLFYEASHLFDIETLYYGYPLFRGTDYLLTLSSYRNTVCILAGAALAVVIILFGLRRENP